MSGLLIWGGFLAPPQQSTRKDTAMRFRPKAAAGLLAFAVAASGVTLAAATPAEAAVSAQQTSVSAKPPVKKIHNKQTVPKKKRAVKKGKSRRLVVNKSCTKGGKKIHVKATVVGAKPRTTFIKGCKFVVTGGKVVKLDRTVTLTKTVNKTKTVTKHVLVPGPAGKQGPAGKDGMNGRDGKDGKNGRDGKDGKDAPRVTIKPPKPIPAPGSPKPPNKGDEAGDLPDYEFGIFDWNGHVKPTDPNGKPKPNAPVQSDDPHGNLDGNGKPKPNAPLQADDPHGNPDEN